MNKLDAFLEFRMLFPKMVHSLISNTDLQLGKKENLNKTQTFTILHVWVHKECKMNFLCTHLNVTKSTMTSIIDSLEKRNLVIRVRKETDRRSIYINLTEDGKVLGKKIKNDISDHFNYQMSLLDSDEQKLFWDSLENINNIINKIERKNGNE